MKNLLLEYKPFLLFLGKFIVTQRADRREIAVRKKEIDGESDARALRRKSQPGHRVPEDADEIVARQRDRRDTL